MQTESGDNAPEKSSRRRRPRTRKPKSTEPKEVDTAVATATTEPRAQQPKRERRRITTAPVEAGTVGKTLTGRICDIIRRGNGRFGFINIGDNIKPREDVPRVYFSLSEYTDNETYPARRGYHVEFLACQDETGRYFASNVHLTSEGKVHAEARATAAPATESKREEAQGEGESKERRPRVRRPRDDRVFNLKVTCEGQEGEKLVEAKMAQSIGKLKHAAVSEFGAPVEYNVYCNINSSNPSGEFLTKAILATLQEGDHIRLAPARAQTA